MSAQKTQTKALEDIKRTLVEFDEDGCRAACEAALAAGIDARTAIDQGLAAGMKVVADLYEQKEYFVPELLLCSDALYAGLAVLKPHIRVEDVVRKGKLLIGVVEGDIHDIGKNLVKAMFIAGGWDVIDAGKDVPLQELVARQKTEKADIVAISALMTSSMLAMPRVIRMLREIDPKVKIMVGGAPLTADIARQYGADGYADDAVSAVSQAAKLLLPVSTPN